MNVTKLRCVFVSAVFISVVSFAESKPVLHQDMGQCLGLLHKTVFEDKDMYRTSADLLLSGGDKERNYLLSLCYAFYEQPDIFADHVTHFVRTWQKRTTSGKPLHNGTVFAALPGSRLYATYGNELDQYSLGDFVNLDNDGKLGFVVGFSVFITNGKPAIPGCNLEGFFTYRATF